jgi:hypothetical protein
MTHERAAELLNHVETPSIELATLKILPDGSAAWIQRFLFTIAIVVAHSESGLAYGYDDRYCYHFFSEACQALKEWDGEGDPEGWHRNPPTGRRRPDGDASKEYVSF